MSSIGTLDNPDFILIDLDPQEGCPFAKIVEAILIVRRKLDLIALEGYPKTTGGDGMHVYVPVEPVYSYEQTRTFAQILATIVAAERPDLFTTPRPLSRREKGKVYFDYVQNAKGKTIAGPYVLRAYEGAPVATPLAWREVTAKLTPQQFHIRNAVDRCARCGDLFQGVLSNRQRLEPAMERLEPMVRALRR
jgi:bifunctional non-homologous end joining protein LigD